MPEELKVDTQFPYVQDWQLDIIAEFGHLFVDTGGNDPRDLLNDFQKPSPNNLMKVNIVRFTLAMGIHAQVRIIQILRKNGLLATDVLEWLIRGPADRADVAYYLCERDGYGYTGIVSYDEDGDASVEEVDYSYQPDADATPADVIAIIQQERKELEARREAFAKSLHKQEASDE